MLAQAVAPTARDTVHVIDTLRVVDTVWVAVTPHATGTVEVLTAWSTIVVGVAAIIALILPMLDRRRQRKSVDAAISADAYAVRKTLSGWINSFVHLQVIGGTPRTFVLGEQDKEVEERLQRAMAAAPHASRRVANAIRAAFVLYYRVTAAPEIQTDALRIEAARKAQGAAHLADMQACVARLADAIEPELREPAPPQIEP
jgi:hypothetical protein